MKKYALLLSLISSISASFPSFGTTILDGQELDLSYEIHSTSPYSNRKELTLSIDLPSLQWNVGADCSGFDAGISVSGLMNDLESQFNRMQIDVVNGVKGYATRLPLLAIQRMDPSMYEMISNGIIKAEDIFSFSVQSCESMASNFSQNGFSAMADESFWFEFSSSLSGDKEKKEVDVVRAMKDKGTKKGEAGVPNYGGGICGNHNSNLCKPVEDVVNAGVDITFKDELDEKEKPNIRKSWIKNVFKDSDSAIKWIVKTLGTVEYGTCQSCDKYKEKVGHGIYSDLSTESSSISTKLFDLVDNGEIPTRGDLLGVSVNDLYIDENVIYALRNETVYRQAFINNISDNLALMKVVDKLLAARRVLLAGKSDPNFQSVSQNIDIIDKKIALVSEEITLLTEELALKNSAKGDSVALLMKRYKQRRSLDYRNSSQSIDKEVIENINRISGRGN